MKKINVVFLLFFVFSGFVYSQTEATMKIHKKDKTILILTLADIDSVTFMPCSDFINSPPDLPFNPVPADNQSNLMQSLLLKWQCKDPDGDQLIYNVYFGTDANPPLIKENLLDTFYNPGVLNPNTGYFWKIDVRDSYNNITEGKIWSFKTIVSVGDMILVEGGSFQMGQPDPDIGGIGLSKDEQPVHNVNISSFYLSKYEVTQKLWKDVMGNNPAYFSGCDECPVEQVSWNDVQSFIAKLNSSTGLKYRLPTEAEWEYAAKGGNKSLAYLFSGSNTLVDVSWCWDNADKVTHPVGMKAPNELGLYDMTGNVWEWCYDWYVTDYYSSSSNDNPQGPNTGTIRVLRGGSWGNTDFNSRSAKRFKNNPGSKININGFRLAMSL
ncbi:MAG: formylglycine-generating enzyme family protein [Bacteroidales bacterium]|nr:formylglycine-generating enzyme family protein [Bacteroidales bacterium]